MAEIDGEGRGQTRTKRMCEEGGGRRGKGMVGHEREKKGRNR